MRLDVLPNIAFVIRWKKLRASGIYGGKQTNGICRFLSEVWSSGKQKFIEAVSQNVNIELVPQST